MSQLSTHQQFYQSVADLHNSFAAVEHTVQNKEQQLFSHIDQLVHAVQKTAQASWPATIEKTLEAYFAQTNQVLRAWQQRVQQHDAGLKFRNRFGDSLLVYVYGKVKAGKSSLGNYIATGHSAPTEANFKEMQSLWPTPQFFMEEKNDRFAEQVNHKQGFQIGTLETTSCIQGFTVPGLTWVDSPGLHSVNAENGELAQKYVDSADLVIYPMNSEQPGRASDFAELESLLIAGKRILVLITRSDHKETDCDEHGKIISMLMMKTDQARQDQQQYAQKELDVLSERLGLLHADTEVLSISVAYAESQQNSPQAMKESGLQALFEKLQSVMQSEGVELKKRVPLDNLQAFYQALLAQDGELSLMRLQRPLKEALAEVTQLQGQVERLKEQAFSQINYQFAREVDGLVEKHVGSRNMAALEADLQQCIQQAIAQYYIQPVEQLYSEAVASLDKATAGMGLCVDMSFSDKTQDITVDVTYQKHVGTGIGSVLGGGIGAFVGGPIGMAIGSTLGGLAGNMAGSMFTKQEVHSIRVGDNREDIKAALQQKGQRTIHTYLNAAHQQVGQEVFTPVHHALETVLKQSQQFENYLQEQRDV